MFRVPVSRLRQSVALCVALAATPLHAATFAQPLHLTREVTDSASGRTQRIEEYYAGDRAVVVAGPRSTVVDVKNGTVTRIDRTTGSYSIARIPTARPATKSARQVAARPLAPMTLADRHAEVLEFEATHDARRELTRIAGTADVTLTRAEFEMLALVAGELPEYAAKALRTSTPGAASSATAFKLPLMITNSWELAGDVIEVSNTVVAIARDVAPPDVSAIPAGARRIEPPLDVLASARELDRPAGR